MTRGTAWLPRIVAPVVIAVGLTTGAFAVARTIETNEKAVLARFVQPVNAESARLIAHADTDVTRQVTPFLIDGAIFMVVHRGPYRPIGFTVGYARPDNWIGLLATDHQAFAELVRRAGVRLDSDPLRIQFARTLLETTRAFDRPFTVLRSWDDLKPVPAPTPAQVERLQELQRAYAERIALPQTRGPGPWRLPLYVLSGFDLELHTVTLEPSGAFEVSVTPLETATPLLAKPTMASAP